MCWTEFGHLSLPRSETVHFSSDLDIIRPLRKRWLYNNWGYGLADCVIEKLTRDTWGRFLTEEIFRLNRMMNTTLHHVTESETYAEGYMSLTDDTPGLEEGKLLEGAVAVQSNIRELLQFYKHLMEAERIIKRLRGIVLRL
ncbi:hypothetical protein EJ08DRAFT_219128 [Tothia fuscella]|uniref:Beta-lactamase-related domain-containing protein n=1 Tax=Tothia fuscella TaxID=1048955 RepID=A0A9P4NSS2_9PEZI|nr:hypothetical protein EJ08DRAFT_219128 [Tothia fuscella]